MPRLYAQLADLDAADDPVRVAVVGAGRMGRSLIVGSEVMDGVDVVAVADVRLDRAREAFRSIGHGEDAVGTVSTADEGDEVLADGRCVVTDDALVPPKLSSVDAVIGATGVPEIGAKVAVRAILNDTHVVMLTDETDAVVGPYLSALAAETGVVYSAAAGDEPGAILELYDFARSLGFEVVAAGKGKNNPLDRTATPSDLASDAEAKDLNPEIYTAFVDGTNTMLEMTMVANATGLGVDRRGMHGPEVSGVHDLPTTFDRSEAGGLLSRTGVVEYVLGGDVAPGVFVVVTTDNETIEKDMAYLSLGEGPNYVLHRTYHIPTSEPLLTAARAHLYGDANLIPQAPVVDTVTVAKRTLTPGDDIDGIGGHSVYGTVESAEVAREEDLVPISLVEGATVTSAIDRGQPLRYNDVELRDSDLFHLRMLQDSYF